MSHRSDGAVLVVGAGGLGSAAALALAGAGIRRLGIADHDRIDETNLHRQPLFGEADVGRHKATVTAERLSATYPDLFVEPYSHAVSAENALPLLAGYDFIIDATDAVGTKFLLNDSAVLLERPLSHAGVVGLTAQILTILPHQSACLRCLFPLPPDESEIVRCRDSGILGPLAGFVGALQANEALRFLDGSIDLLADRLLTIDARTLSFREVPLQRSDDCPLCGPRATIRVLASDASPEENP